MSMNQDTAVEIAASLHEISTVLRDALQDSRSEDARSITREERIAVSATALVHGNVMAGCVLTPSALRAVESLRTEVVRPTPGDALDALHEMMQGYEADPDGEMSMGPLMYKSIVDVLEAHGYRVER